MLSLKVQEKIAEGNVKAASFFARLTHDPKQKRPYAGVAGYEVKKTGLVLVSTKVYALTEKDVKEFFERIADMEVAYKVTTGTDRKTDAADDEPRIEYILVGDNAEAPAETSGGDLSKLNKAELAAVAKYKGIEVPPDAKKEDIVALLS